MGTNEQTAPPDVKWLLSTMHCKIRQNNLFIFQNQRSCECVAQWE